MSRAPWNRLLADPTLKDVLNLHTTEVMLSLNCHAIATVQSFDSDEQTVTATVNYQKSYLEINPDTGVYQEKLRSYPVMVDVPVIILGGGAASLTFPVAAGDQCLILFNDRDIDNWVGGARNGPPNTSRLHSFSDGLCLVGLNPISSYDTARAVFQNGTTLVGLGASLIKITNGAGSSLGSILANFFTTCSAATTAAQIAAAAATALPLIQGLLE